MEAQKEKTRQEEMAKEQMAETAEGFEVNYHLKEKNQHGECLDSHSALTVSIVLLESCVL